MLLTWRLRWSLCLVCWTSYCLLLLLFQITTATMKAADVEAVMDSVFCLMDKWGHENYIGEQVTQLQHAQQVCS